MMKFIFKTLIGVIAGSIIAAGVALPASATILGNNQSGTNKIIADINMVRVQNGLSALPVSQAVTDAAINWANTEMSNSQPIMYHNPYLIRDLTPATQAGEVLSILYTADQVVGQWMNSPTHRGILLSNTWSTMGIAYIPDGNGYYYAVVDFAAYANAPVNTATAPEAPAAVTGSMTGFDANITWAAAVDNGNPVTNYQIQVFNADLGSNVFNAFTGTTLSVAVPSLQRGVRYYALVHAYNAGGWGATTQSNTFSVAALAPEKITNLNLVKYSDTALQATWSTSSNDGGAAVRYYIVKLYQGSDLYMRYLANAPTTSKTFTDLPADGSIYTFTVTANNNIGESNLSDTSAPVILGAAPTPVPTVIPTPVVTPNQPAPAPTQGVIPTPVITPAPQPTTIQATLPVVIPAPLPQPTTPNQSVTPTPVVTPTPTITTPVVTPVPSPPTIKPEQPAFKKVTTGKDNAVLRWSNVQTSKVDITRYVLQVKRLVKNHGVYKVSGKARELKVNDLTTSKKITGLTRHTRYTVTVTAYAKNGAKSTRTLTFTTR